MNLANSLLPTIEQIGVLAYWVIFFISLAESLAFVGLLIPGTIFMMGIGFLASNKIIDIGDAFVFAIAGAIAGDAISFYLGRRGTNLFKTENKIFKLTHLNMGEKFFFKHGNKSIFLGRFIGPLRPIIPFVAGMFKMKAGRFFFWNILSAIGWGIFYISIGYFFGESWKEIATWAHKTKYFVITLALIIIIFYFLKIIFQHIGKQIISWIKIFWNNLKIKAEKNPACQKFNAKHPYFIKFLKERIKTDNFFGLPLTFFALIFIYVAYALLGLTEDILNLKTITYFDSQLAHYFTLFHHAKLLKIFHYITYLGEWKIIFVVSVFLAIFFFLKYKKYFLSLAVTICGSAATIYLGKILIERPRPLEATYLEDSFSFPSGHAAIAVAFYGFVAYFLCREIKSWRTKNNIIFSALILILLIGFSRLYLEVHFLSDVLGGYLLGILWLIIGISITELNNKK
ncbi:MAG: bifunctional DedA family/phosphatase PAP2 family protein [Patescibacteria group bacterium]|nr:bifunctional DedA family/phosphatase PAP2 family protein [Patescibacteria group bacterium]MDD4610884.1 bifunctional DedA family/phosphatase PAP2 family protein [Patescibacteria group bacterium]